MATTTGFYANETETFYVTPTGKVWIVQSEDGPDRPAEIAELPTDAMATTGPRPPDGFASKPPSTPPFVVKWTGL